MPLCNEALNGQSYETVYQINAVGMSV